jgi:hypothetical protein
MRVVFASLLLMLALNTITSITAFDFGQLKLPGRTGGVAELRRALDSSSQNSTVTKLTSPLNKFSANLLRRQPAKHPLRPVTLRPTLEPPMYLLQPTFEPFDPSLKYFSYSTKGLLHKKVSYA